MRNKISNSVSGLTVKRSYRRFIVGLIALAVLNSCGVYKKYQSQNEAPDDLFGRGDSIAKAMNDSSIANISWREFFEDPLLQQLIDSALVRNTDLLSAKSAVLQAQASLRAAKLAYLPSLSLNPQASISTQKFGSAGSGTGLGYSYNIPLQLDWNIGISGSVTVNKRKAQAVLEQAEAARDATQANLISTVAQYYFQLLMLDKELQILIETDSLWEESLETERALWENGQAYSTAVNQMESSCMSVKTQIVDTKRSILSAENELCKLLRMTPQPIARHTWGEFRLPERFTTGVPATLLENRPDIKVADKMLAEAFYNTALARAQFFPSFNLTGLLGWIGESGADPGALLMKLAASVMQPVFAQGKLTAQLKIAKLNQEDKLYDYIQTVLKAGNQVNEALADCQVAKDKDVLYKRQVVVLRDAYTGTHELMNAGKASYIEVLTAQESLLSAQLNEASNLYEGAQALIGLYIALGGATK